MIQNYSAKRCCNRCPGSREKALRRYCPEYFHNCVIRVNNGIVHCSKGSVSSSALRGVQRVIEEESIAHGKIRMTKAGKIRF